MVNHFYFYAVDRDFGPFFLKFGTYFPYTGKLCLNGHEYVKRQLVQRGIAYEALDNGGRRSRPCYASGWRACRTRLPRAIAAPGTAIGCRSGRPSSASRRCSTAPRPAGRFSKRSFARTSISGVRIASS